MNIYLRKWFKSIYSALCGYNIFGLWIEQYSYNNIYMYEGLCKLLKFVTLAKYGMTSNWNKVFENGYK